MSSNYLKLNLSFLRFNKFILMQSSLKMLSRLMYIISCFEWCVFISLFRYVFYFTSSQYYVKSVCSVIYNCRFQFFPLLSETSSSWYNRSRRAGTSSYSNYTSIDVVISEKQMNELRENLTVPLFTKLNCLSSVNNWKN